MADGRNTFQQAVTEVETGLKQRNLLLVLALVALSLTMTCVNIYLVYADSVPETFGNPDELPLWAEDELQTVDNKLATLKSGIERWKRQQTSPNQVDAVFRKEMEASLRLIKKRLGQVSEQSQAIVKSVYDLQKSIVKIDERIRKNQDVSDDRQQ